MINENLINRFIWVTFKKPGFHYYPGAKDNPKLEDVEYLASKHRHLFGFKIQIEIFHQDRDIEFHQFLNYCQSLFESGTIDIDYKSVEMLADDLYIQISSKYPNRDIVIDIDEDSECGCSIIYRKYEQ